MRQSPLRDVLAARRATFGEQAGAEVARSFGSFEQEYSAVREAVGLTDFSFASRFRVPESGLDALERYAAGSVANIRFGRVLHTLAADEEGFVEADLYIANDDEHFLLIGEGLVGNEATQDALRKLGGADAAIEDLSNKTALIGIDGYKAWAVAKELFGADVLGLPYLSLETYQLDGLEIKLMRSGKTSEFGYLLLVPSADARGVWERIERSGAPFGLKCVGFDAHSALRLDGRFFNIHAEGRAVRDPLALGLQWMIDFGGEDFCGKGSILARRSAGLKKKIIGVIPAAGSAADLKPGTRLRHNGADVARMVTSALSPVLQQRIGLALFDVEYAYSGLEFEDERGDLVHTVSMPPFTPKSLTVKLDEI